MTCPGCGEHRLTIEDAMGSRVKRREGVIYVEAACPECYAVCGLVIGSERAVWPCTVDEEPCGLGGCTFCDS